MASAAGVPLRTPPENETPLGNVSPAASENVAAGNPDACKVKPLSVPMANVAVSALVKAGG